MFRPDEGADTARKWLEEVEQQVNTRGGVDMR